MLYLDNYTPAKPTKRSARTIEKFIQTNNKAETILPHFIANKNTLAIIPARHFEYASIVIEKSKTHYIRKTPQQIIKDTCYRYLSTYAGRRKAIIKQTGFKYKVPILLNEKESLISFPTKAPSQFDCVWIFLTRIITFQKENRYSSITFQNELKLRLNISFHSLRTQFYRAQSLYMKANSEEHFKVII